MTNQKPTLEQVSAEIVTEGLMRREEICARLGIGEDVLEVCLPMGNYSTP